MSTKWKIALVGCLLLYMASGYTQQDIPWNLSMHTTDTLESEGAAVFLKWEIPDHQSLWEDAVIMTTPCLKSFQDSLQMKLGLERYKVAINRKSNQSWPVDKIPGTRDGDGYNAALVQTGTVGRIRPISVLEAQILNYQLCRYPLLSHPTEFHGFILKHPELEHVRVYFAASDQPWPPKPGVIIDAVTADLLQGWQLRYHLHNHYEPPADHYIGVLAPSLADAQYFKALVQRFDLQQALITNGFHTVVLDPDEFEKFQSH